MEKEHPEAGNRHLCVQIDPAAEAELPEASVSKCLENGARLDRVHLGRSSDYGSPCKRAGKAQCREVHERGLGSTRRCDRWKRESRNEPTERDRGLTYSEREPALIRREPLHDGAATRRLHARAGGTREREQADQIVEGRRKRAGDEENGARPEAERERSPFTEAIRGQSPRQERHGRADPRRCEEHAHLGDRQSELRLQRRRDDRQPHTEHRSAGLRRRARRENRPAISHASGGRVEVVREVLHAGVGLLMTTLASARSLAASRSATVTLASVDSPSSSPESIRQPPPRRGAKDRPRAPRRAWRDRRT